MKKKNQWMISFVHKYEWSWMINGWNHQQPFLWNSAAPSFQLPASLNGPRSISSASSDHRDLRGACADEQTHRHVWNWYAEKYVIKKGLKCQKDCQKICQNICQKKCQQKCQKIYQNRISQKCQKRMSEDMPERMSEEMSEDMSEEMWTVTEMSEGMPEDTRERM